jgi:hypothetical protein
MGKRPITEEVQMARRVRVCRGYLSVFGVWSSAALGLISHALFAFSFLAVHNKQAAAPPLWTRAAMKSPAGAHEKPVDVSPGNSARSCSGWRSQQIVRGRTVGVFSAQSECLG